MDDGRARAGGVLESDDDLGNFLAGLRAKYATLYPQAEDAAQGLGELTQDHASHLDRDQPAVPEPSLCARLPAEEPPAEGPRNSIQMDTMLSGTQGNYDERLTQLRASLQSLQQLLPVRPAVSANLLSQFSAAAAAAVNPAAAGMPQDHGEMPAGGAQLERSTAAHGLQEAEAASPSAASPRMALDSMPAAPMHAAAGAAAAAAEEDAPDVHAGVAAHDDPVFTELASAYGAQPLSEPSAESVAAQDSGSTDDFEALHALLLSPAAAGSGRKQLEPPQPHDSPVLRRSPSVGDFAAAATAAGTEGLQQPGAAASPPQYGAAAASAWGGRSASPGHEAWDYQVGASASAPAASSPEGVLGWPLPSASGQPPHPVSRYDPLSHSRSSSLASPQQQPMPPYEAVYGTGQPSWRELASDPIASGDAERTAQHAERAVASTDWRAVAAEGEAAGGDSALMSQQRVAGPQQLADGAEGGAAAAAEGSSGRVTQEASEPGWDSNDELDVMPYDGTAGDSDARDGSLEATMAHGVYAVQLDGAATRGSREELERPPSAGGSPVYAAADAPEEVAPRQRRRWSSPSPPPLPEPPLAAAEASLPESVYAGLDLAYPEPLGAAEEAALALGPGLAVTSHVSQAPPTHGWRAAAGRSLQLGPPPLLPPPHDVLSEPVAPPEQNLTGLLREAAPEPELPSSQQPALPLPPPPPQQQPAHGARLLQEASGPATATGALVPTPDQLASTTYDYYAAAEESLGVAAGLRTATTDEPHHHQHQPPRSSAAAAGSDMISGPGGVAFTIDVGGGGSGRANAHSPAVGSLPLTAHHHATASKASPLASGGGGAARSLPVGAAGHQPDWQRLDKQLREAGFGGLQLTCRDDAGQLVPDAAAVHRCLTSVLDQYGRRNRLVQELLAATEGTTKSEGQHAAALRAMQLEVNHAKAAAERARCELQEMSSLRLPRTEAQHRQELTKARSEAAKLKESMRNIEKQLATRDEEAKALRATIASLQTSSAHAADVELTTMRARVAQLEATLRARDKEVVKVKAITGQNVEQATGGQATALDRAYEAEALARKLEPELAGWKAKAGSMEQALRLRERDVATMREDLAAIKACETAATAAAQERAAGAEEACRKLEADAGSARTKVKELEALLKATRQEVANQKSQVEAVKSAAYDEIYRLEDDCRQSAADLVACRAKVTQLEHVIRAKDREVAKAKDEKEAARAAERERVKVAEDVAVKLEMDLTNMKIRGTQLEGAVRSRDREIEKMAELLRLHKGAEYEVYMKQNKAEEGWKRTETDFMQSRMRILQLETQLKARDKDVEKLGRQLEQIKADAHELSSKATKAEEAARKLEGELATTRGKALNLEGHLRVKEREQDRLVRVVEQLKCGESESLARQSALEDAARRLDAELVAVRAKGAQLEGLLRARDAAVERLNRQLESTKTQEFESAAQYKETEEAARKLDAEAGGMRQRLLQLEGAVKSRERDLERQARQLDTAQQAAAEAAMRQAEAEAAARKVDGDTAVLRQRLAQTDGVIRSKEREVERACKMAEMTKASELEVAIRLAQSEETASRLDGELAAQRSRVLQLEGALKAKDKELQVALKAVEVVRVVGHEANVAVERSEETARKLDAEAAAVRARVGQLEGALKAKERELEKVMRVLQQQRSSEYETVAQRLAAEEAARKVDEEAVQLRQRVVQLEGAVKAKEREAERAAKQLEVAQQAAAAAAAGQAEAEASLRKADGDSAGLRQRLAQAEGAAKAKERELERLQKLMEQVKASEAEAELRQAKADAAAVQLDGDLAAARTRLQQADAAARAKDKDVERLQRVIDQCKAAEVEASLKAQRAEEACRGAQFDLAALRQQLLLQQGATRTKDKELDRLNRALELLRAADYDVNAKLMQAEEAARRLDGEVSASRSRLAQLDGALRAKAKENERLSRQLAATAAAAGELQSSATASRSELAIKQQEAELSSCRSRLMQLEASLVARDKEAQRLQRLLVDAEGRAEAQASKTQDFMCRVETDLGNMRTRTVQLAGLLKSKEREVERLAKALEATRGSEHDAAAELLRLQDELRKAEAQLATHRQQLVQVEGSAKVRVKEVERLTKQLEAAAAAEAKAVAQQLQAEEAARKLEAEQASLRRQLHSGEQAARAKDKELERQQAAVEAARAAEYEAGSRQLQAEEAVKQLEVEMAAKRQQIAQADSALRAAQREIARVQRQAAAASSKQSEAAVQAAVLQDETIKLDTDLGRMRQQLVQVQLGLRSRDCEIGKLLRQLDQTKAAEYETLSKNLQADEALRRVDTDLSALRSRLMQVEGQAKARDGEVARLQKLLDAGRASELELEARYAQSEEAVRQLEVEAAAGRQRAGVLDGMLRAKERDADKALKAAEAAKVAHAELELRVRRSEEQVARLEGELASARSAASQAEGGGKLRDKEVERLRAALEQAKTLQEELAQGRSRAEESCRKLEGDAANLRQRLAQAEGAVRAKDKELDRQAKAADVVRAGDADTQARMSKLEETIKALEVEAATARGRALRLESTVRVKERELERLGRSLEATRGSAAETTSAQLQAEDLARRLDGELAQARIKTSQLEGQLKARDKEVDKLGKQLEAQQRATEEAAAAAQQPGPDEAGRRPDEDTITLRRRVGELERCIKSKEKDIERLQRGTDAAVATAANQLRDAQDSARALESEAAAARSRLVTSESQARARDGEVSRLQKLLEATRASELEFSSKHLEAQDAARRAAEEAVSLRQQLAAVQGSVRAKESEVARLVKAADVAKGAEADLAARHLQAEEACRKVEGELLSCRQRVTHLESQLRGRERDVERLSKQLEASGSSVVETAAQVDKVGEAARKLDMDVSHYKARVAQLESLVKVKEKELERLSKQVAACESDATAASSRSDEAVRRLETELVSCRQRLALAEASAKARDKEAAGAVRALDASKLTEEDRQAELSQMAEELSKAQAELTQAKQRLLQCDGLVRTKDKDLERLQRLVEQAREQQQSSSLAVGKEASAVKDRASKLEGDLQASRARVTALEGQLVAKEREAEQLGRLAGYARAGDAEAAAQALERAGRAEEAAKRLDLELAAVRMRYTQVEHLARSREAVIDKLKDVLSDKVAKEERRLARDKQTYTRLRSAVVASASSGGQAKAAGAMAAAARELRPVEIVGLYETTRENLERELAGCKAEVRSLAEQLRDAQNLIALKDRSGAWRTPQELTDMHTKTILLERRAGELQRELDRQRIEGAEQVRMAERRVGEAERRSEQLKEDNDALVLELEGRPSLAEHRTLKREIEILEKRLLQLRGSSAANAPGAQAEGGELSLGLATAAKGRGGAGAESKLVTTTQRIARDRDVHRLGLRVLEDFPKDVLVDIMQDVCIELDVADATTLLAAVRKALRLTGAVPRMESFISEVCEAVYRRGAAFVPPHIDGSRDPHKVLEVLACWLPQLHECNQLRAAMRSISEALAHRPEGLAMPLEHPGDVITSVRQLVEAEATALTAHTSLAAARGYMEAQPEALLSRIVGHFQRCFDCTSLDGVVPAINRLYGTLAEQRNFAKGLAATLGLPAESGAASCMARVRALLEQAAAGGGGEQLQQDYVRQQGHSGPRGAPPLQGPAAAGPADAQQQHAAALLERLMALFGARSHPQLLEACEKVSARLVRLDEVLPRYQRLASQLYELLRVSNLEEVVPALRAQLGLAR